MESWNKLWEKTYNVKSYRVGVHLIFWLFYFFAFSFWEHYILAMVGWKGESMAVMMALCMLMNIIVIAGSYYLTVFTCYHFLVNKHRTGWFFALLLANLLIFCLLLIGGKLLAHFLIPVLGVDIPSQKSEYFLETRQLNNLFGWSQMIVSYFALLCLPVSAKFFRDQMRHQKKESTLEKKNLQLQMDFLKAQIHPHFLFNTLNNIYSLTTDKESEKASDMISRLSSLLRYVLYKAKSDFISLENEVEMIRDFIDLEAIRSDNLELKLDFPGSIPVEIFLPPFLLLPLVENSFKHGVNSQMDRSFVEISLKIEQDSFQLQVSNNFDDDYRKKNAGGLGLTNLRKRLNYYYQKTFSFETIETENHFTATLNLPFVCPKRNA